jgi:hypothetical protein
MSNRDENTRYDWGEGRGAERVCTFFHTRNASSTASHRVCPLYYYYALWWIDITYPGGRRASEPQGEPCPAMQFHWPGLVHPLLGKQRCFKPN